MKPVRSLLLLLASTQAMAAQEPADPVALVASLYQEYAWEAVIDEPRVGETFYFGTEASLQKYLTPELVALILADRARSEASGELGAIDFAVLWASQDPGAMQLRIEQTEGDNRVQVSFTHPGSREQTRILHQLESTAKGWRIADIQYAEGFSLRLALAAPQP